MLHHHQTLLSSSSSSSSGSLSFFHFPYSRSSQVEEERSMEFSLATQSHVSDYVDESMMGSVAERNDVVSVEEYLADDYFLDVETYDKENETLEGGGGGGDESKPPSALSFEAPPLSELALPAHDEAELEWVSMIMDDSLSEIPKAYGNHLVPAKNFKIDEAPNPTQPPPPTFAPMKAKRSKRSRTLSAASWSSSSSSSSSTTTTASSVSSSSFSSPQLILAHHLFDEIPHPISRPPPPPPSKKRGRKPKAAATKSQAWQLVSSHGRGGGGGERRCSHCGVSRTPQWRAGPHGARTLCNACGVRYKSGRLLPEYRPACSPTFVSHVHSNSHRKVLEMRRKEEERREGGKLLLVCSAPPVASF